MTITIDRAQILAAAPSLPAGWSAVSNAAGGTVAPNGGRIRLSATATAHDTITASSATNAAVCIEHALPATGVPGSWCARFDDDTSDIKAWGINLLLRDGTGGWVRWCVSKANDNTERPNFFAATRPAGGGAGTNHTVNQNVNTTPHRLQSQAPSYLRIDYDGVSQWALKYSTDGVTWIDHSTVTRAFTPTHLLVGFTSTTPLTAGGIHVGKVVDLAALGSTDVRNAPPARDLSVISEWSGDVGAVPTGWTADSAAGDSVTVTGGTVRFRSDAANVGSRARWVYSGAVTAEEADLLLIVRSNAFSGNAFATWGLFAPVAGGLDPYVAGHGYGLEVGQTARRPIRVDDWTNSNISVVVGTTGLWEVPYGWEADATGVNMGTGTPIRAFRLQRIGTDGARRFRCKEWAGVTGANLAATITATKAAEPAAWALYDGHDEVERGAALAPSIALAHNNPAGGLTGTSDVEVLYQRFAALVEPVVPPDPPAPTPSAARNGRHMAAARWRRSFRRRRRVA